MSKQIEQIITEVQRRLDASKKVLPELRCPENISYYKGCIEAYEWVISFLQLIPEEDKEEPVSNDFDEVFGHLADVYYNNVLMDEHPMPEDIAHQCRLSYFLGLKAGANYQKQQDYIPVSNDLEAEIQRYYNSVDGYPRYVQTARHFARWQEQQDDKDTSDMLVVTYLRGGDEGKKIMVDKACKWLEENLINYWGQLFANYYGQISANDTEQFIKNFRKAMLK